MQNEIDNFDANLERDVSNSLGDNAQKLIHALLKRGCDKWKEEEGFSASIWRAIIVDIAEHKRYRPDIYRKDAEDLDTEFRTPRRPEKAKKRFQYVSLSSRLLFMLSD